MLVADGNAWMIIQDNFGPVMSASIFSKSINYDRHKVMANGHMTPWIKWANKNGTENMEWDRHVLKKMIALTNISHCIAKDIIKKSPHIQLRSWSICTWTASICKVNHIQTSEICFFQLVNQSYNFGPHQKLFMMLKVYLSFAIIIKSWI